MARYRSSRNSWPIISVVALLVVVGLFYWAFKRLSPGKPGGGPVGVASGDPDMQAARKEAQFRWDQLLSLWRDRRTGQKFFVKAQVSEGFVGEYLWVQVRHIGDDGVTITGAIDTQPTRIKKFSVGDMIVVKRDNVFDWLFEGPAERFGGWTIPVMGKIETQRGIATQPATQP